MICNTCTGIFSLSLSKQLRKSSIWRIWLWYWPKWGINYQWNLCQAMVQYYLSINFKVNLGAFEDLMLNFKFFYLSFSELFPEPTPSPSFLWGFDWGGGGDLGVSSQHHSIKICPLFIVIVVVIKFSYFHLLHLQNHWTILTKLGTKHP